MSKYSDHKDSQNTIEGLLPEVFKSDVNNSLFGTAFDRHLTKDDTSRVSGFVGESNASALVDRRIKEPTPHRQAFQLAPTMQSIVGTEQTALSFKAFQQQLKLMGVDMDRLPIWGSTTKFNWVPPVNVDMMVNYQDYFWKPAHPSSQPQYLTIENRCNKAKSKVESYTNMLKQRGESFAVKRINYATSEIVLDSKYDDLFVPGFVFFTKNSSKVNMENKFWTVVASVYDVVKGETLIHVVNTTTSLPLAPTGVTDPAAGTTVGEWFFNTSTQQLKGWTGTGWNLITPSITLTISLIERLQVYRAQANCTCNQDIGWDIAQWDDNPLLWNATLLTSITHGTEAAWIAVNGAAVDGSIWYDTSSDVLKQYKATAWNIVTTNFSQIIADTGGTSLWDLSNACAPQSATQWSSQNEWIHKSEVQSSSGVKRAHLPIIEYDSSLELNEWITANYTWKYRSEPGKLFDATSAYPSRLELEPIKGYYAEYSGAWKLYLFHKDSTMYRDVDYSDTFVPGYRFRITDDTLAATLYTVSAVEYREITSADSATVKTQMGVIDGDPNTRVMCTIITIAESVFSNNVIATGNIATDPLRTRIEPTQTSQGHAWRGYHAHWVLDTNGITFSPTANQRWNLYRARSVASETQITPTADFAAGVVGIAHVEYTIGGAGVTTINLPTNLQYSPTTAHFYATPDSNEIRVYVNGVRQYGTYTELVNATGTPNYTLVGQTPQSSQHITFVTGITFTNALNVFDVVRIEVGAAPFNCMGNSAIPVRTIEDEAQFTLATAQGTQPVYRSMTRCYNVEQTKTLLNQYPLFNTYDVATSAVVAATPVFSFKEDPEAAINTLIQKRIAASTDGKEYTFEQHLIDRDDNIIYAYRNIQAGELYWYSPLTNKAYQWDGYAWTDRVVIPTATGVEVRRITVSAQAPSSPLASSIWFDTVNQQLKQYVGGAWTLITNVVINGTDPMLRTIWRHGLNNEQYVPQYVNSTRTPVTVGDASGDWEVVDQWMYNPEHHNHKEIKYSELVTHFRSIIDGQPKIPGLQGGGIFTLSQSDYNYGLGGSIKEHNDSFDTLISAVNVANVTPPSVIEFAAREYDSSLLRIRDVFNSVAVELFKRYGKDTFIDFTGTIGEDIITQYEQNDYTALLYGDTSAFDATTGLGIRNWISTIPMFGLGAKYSPHISIDGQTVYLLHHDGHRSTITYSAAERDRFSRAICNSTDARTQTPLGIISASALPTTKAAFIAAFGGTEVRTGVYWYLINGQRSLYRFAAYDVTPTAPSIYDANGVEIPDGLLYFNRGDNVVYRKTNSVWVAASAPNDLTLLWKEVNFAAVLGEVLLNVEQRLYDVTGTRSLVFDYTTLQSEPTLYNTLTRDRFNSYVAAHDISAPLVNTTYSAVDAFTWNYVTCSISMPPRVDITPTMAACWQELYTRWYGTPYPHLEPWKLQGYRDKPTWWDAEYLETNGSRRWKYDHVTRTGMWEAIRTGTIPAGKAAPSGVVPTYNYFSVNITNAAIGAYAPDALLPPYFNTQDQLVRSLFTAMTQIVNPSGDYAFGDVGPVEWEWSVSMSHQYDLPIVAFQMQPVKFMHSAFGPTYTLVDGLQVDTLYKQVYSHEDAMFHGDVYGNAQQYLVRGLNQWYTNYNRFTGYDTNTEFRELWVGWKPHLTYQFGGIVDTSTFNVSNKYFDISPQDYNVILVNNGVINDVWADAFEISLLNIPPAVVQYNNQNAWKMEIDSLAAISRNINYYGVRHYPITVDSTTDVFTANSMAIVGVSTAARRFYVSGDHVDTFANRTTIAVSGSPSNNGSYTVTSITYDNSSNQTRLTVSQPIPTSTIAGTVQVGVTLPWATGDAIVLSSSKFLPAPLKSETPYYIIRLSSSTFKLAESFTDAQNGLAIDITASGDGVSYASEVESSFYVFGGAGNSAELWFHYALDRNDVRSFTPPKIVTGMQTMVNLIDGYAAYQNDKGVVNYGSEVSDFDPLTGRMVDWRIETERFIDWAFGLRQSRVRVNDTYGVTANATTSQLSFTGMTPHWLSGTPVTLSSTGVLPTPLIKGAVYYVVSTGTPGVIRLSVTANVSDTSAYVTLTDVGSGDLSIGLYDAQRAYPRFEVNPYRNNVWIDTPLGVVSNVIDGPYTDIRVQQTIFDQYNRPLTSDRLTVLREDKRTHITTRPAIQNDVDPIYVDDPYNYIHIGGGHFFIEGYEHFLILNDYTTGGALVYDSFLGLKATRFNVDYYEKADYTLRPTLGGYYLIDQKFERNIEGAISDINEYYDTLGLSETSNVAPRARGLLGYKGRSSFLDMLNINTKSQFLFYKGMIQTKGSINSINAFINSRRFIDAKVDEFWAWKVAEFGDSRVRVYPEVKLFDTDSLVDDVRFEFLAPSELETDPDVVDAVSKGFNVVSFAKPERWYNFPEQKSEIESPLFLDAEVSALTVIYANATAPTMTAIHPNYWFNTNTHQLSVLSGGSWVPVANKVLVQNVDINGIGTDVVYFKHDSTCDDVRVVRKTIDAPPVTGVDYTPEDYTTETLVVDDQYTKVNSSLVRINLGEFHDVIMIFALNPAKSKISPAKLIDTQAGTVVQQVPMWHPARGHHSHLAMSYVDFMAGSDPARYNVTINPSVATSNNWSENFWNQAEVGKVWFDTSYLQYKPYFDDKILPNVNDRLYNWGKLASYGDVKVYQWVKSTVSPSEWKGDGTPRSSTFYRTRSAAVNVNVHVDGTLELMTGTIVAGDRVVFTGTNLPTGIDPLFTYIATPTTGNFFTLSIPATEVAVAVTPTAAVTVSMIRSFKASDWVEHTRIVDHTVTPSLIADATTVGVSFATPHVYPISTTTIAWTPANIAAWHTNGTLTAGTTVDVYKNGEIVEQNLTVQETTGVLHVTLSIATNINEFDMFDVVRPVHTLTPTEQAFDPDLQDDGVTLIDWKVDYNYSSNVQLTDANNNLSAATSTYFYFWVENSMTRTAQLSMYEVAQQLRAVTTPYMIVQRPKDDPILVERYGYGMEKYGSIFSLGTLSDEDSYQVPVLYREAIIRGVSEYINDNERYVVKFTRDFTMRNTLRDSTSGSMLKPKHEEWMLIRRAQTSTIDRRLWDRLTEALIGYSLSDSTKRVPSLERELYDAMYYTDTQYGLGADQAFVEKHMGLATVIAYLQDPTQDFSPLDINSFFNTYAFNTPENIKTAMDVLYTNLSAEHVNNIWFEVLYDSLSLRAKYKELFKTSWVAIHGIKVLEVGGLFDD